MCISVLICSSKAVMVYAKGRDLETWQCGCCMSLKVLFSRMGSLVTLEKSASGDVVDSVV